MPNNKLLYRTILKCYNLYRRKQTEFRFRKYRAESDRPEKTEVITKLNFQQAHEMLSQGQGIVLLDVREEPEYLSGHAVDAELLPVGEITEETAAELIPTKDTTVMVYCRTGRRSAKAARILSRLGYTEIFDMGGLVGWPYGLI